MSLLNSCVEVVPGRSFNTSSAGGGSGGSTTEPFTILPVNAPAGGGVAPAVSISSGTGGITLWVEGLTTQATGTPVNSGNNLTFAPYGDNGVAIASPAPITFQRSNGSIIANNVGVSDVVFSPSVVAGTLKIQGAIGFALTQYAGGGVGGGGAPWATFTPVDTGLYVFEGVCSALVSATSYCIVPPSAFLTVSIVSAPGQTPNPGYRGGSLSLRPFAQPPASTAPTGDRGQQYSITVNNSILLQAGITYNFGISATNPVNVGNTSPGTAQPFGFFADASGTVPDTSGEFDIYAELYSLCRINQPYTPGIPT